MNIFVCRNTVSRSAIFCAVATTIERCKTEGVVDVFQVVKAMRAQKPGAIQTLVRMGEVYCINVMYLFTTTGTVSLHFCRNSGVC